MNCLPAWWVEGTPDVDIVNLHPPDGPIRISLPLGFEDALNPLIIASQNWASRLGRSVTIVPGLTCPPNDGRCITLDRTYQGPGCARIEGNYDPGSGEWDQPLTINLTPNWHLAHPDHLTRRFSHELGHYFGLHHREDASCSCQSTTMGPALSPNCEDPNPPSGGCTLVPTEGDQDALLKSTYGNGNRKTCGW